MKKFITVLVIAAFILPLLNCCGDEAKKETVTASAMQKTTVVDVTEEPTTEEESVPKTENDLQEEFVSEYRHYKFEFEIKDCKKTDYEKNFSKEVLNEIYDLIPMYYGFSFGCDDYDDWSGDPNSVLNDIYHSTGCWMMDGYEYGSEEVKKANEEMNSNPYGGSHEEGFFTSVDKINARIRDVYGPDARQFKPEDFDTYDEIKTSEESVFADYDYSFRFVYLPGCGVVRALARETWGGETPALCLCDVRMSDGYYVAEAIQETYYSFRVKYIMTMSAESDGNIYLKSLDKFYILPDGVENNMKVISEDVQVVSEEYRSEELIVIGTLSLGEEVYSSDDLDSDDEYIWIVSEKCRGKVKKNSLAVIE